MQPIGMKWNLGDPENLSRNWKHHTRQGGCLFVWDHHPYSESTVGGSCLQCVTRSGPNLEDLTFRAKQKHNHVLPGFINFPPNLSLPARWSAPSRALPMKPRRDRARLVRMYKFVSFSPNTRPLHRCIWRESPRRSLGCARLEPFPSVIRTFHIDLRVHPARTCADTNRGTVGGAEATGQHGVLVWNETTKQIEKRENHGRCSRMILKTYASDAPDGEIINFVLN